MCVYPTHHNNNLQLFHFCEYYVLNPWWSVRHQLDWANFFLPIALLVVLYYGLCVICIYDCVCVCVFVYAWRIVAAFLPLRPPPWAAKQVMLPVLMHRLS